MVLVEKKYFIVLIFLTCINIIVRKGDAFASQQAPTPNLFSAPIQTSSPQANIKGQSPSSSIFSVTRRMFSKNPEPVIAIPIKPSINRQKKSANLEELEKPFYKEEVVKSVDLPNKSLVLGDLIKMANDDESLIKISPIDVVLVDKETMNFAIINPIFNQDQKNSESKEKEAVLIDIENKKVLALSEELEAQTISKHYDHKEIVASKNDVLNTKIESEPSIQKVVLPPSIPFFRKQKEVVVAKKAIPIPTPKPFINQAIPKESIVAKNNQKLTTNKTPPKPRINPILEVKKEEIIKDAPMPLLPIDIVIASRAFNDINKKNNQTKPLEDSYIETYQNNFDETKNNEPTKLEALNQSVEPDIKAEEIIERSFIPIIRTNEKQQVIEPSPEIVVTETETVKPNNIVSDNQPLNAEEKSDEKFASVEKTTTPGIVITPKYPEREVWKPANSELQQNAKNESSSKWLVLSVNKDDNKKNDSSLPESKPILRKLEDKVANNWEEMTEPLPQKTKDYEPKNFVTLKNQNVEVALVEKNKINNYGEKLERIDSINKTNFNQNIEQPKKTYDDNLKHFRNHSGETLLANVPNNSNENIRSQPLLTPLSETEKEASKSTSFVDKLTSIFGTIPSTEKQTSVEQINNQEIQSETTQQTTGFSTYSNQISNQNQKAIEKILPSEIRLSFTADKAEISGQTLRWVKSFAEKASKDPNAGIEVRMAIDYSSDLQIKRFSLIQKILKEGGVSPEQIVPVFSMRQANTVVLRNIRVRSQTGFYNPNTPNAGIYYQKW